MQAVGRQRPLGVSIIAIVLLVLGILGLIASILGLIALTAIHSTVLDAGGAVLLIIAIIIAIAEIVLFWGLWTLRPWAFWATAIVEAISVVEGLYGLLVQHNSLAATLIGMIIPLAILIYLFADRNVRAAFRT
jgi:hypothetical protein